jgi:hypothetical protein
MSLHRRRKEFEDGSVLEIEWDDESGRCELTESLLVSAHYSEAWLAELRGFWVEFWRDVADAVGRPLEFRFAVPGREVETISAAPRLRVLP